MTEVVSVKFKDTGKAYFFAPNGNDLKVGSKVIVETQNGNELGIIAVANHQVNDEDLVSPLKKVIRVANEKDLKRVEENKKKAVDALKICEELVAQHGLDMKLVEVEYSFDGSKIVFFFTSDGRVDFRELVRDLAARFHTRIELRQIGVRDEAKLLGGLGICGQPYCCKRFLSDFQPVSIKMAKEQGLSLNPTKISGSCGRLMCCLKYEEDAYSHLASITPRVGSTVKTPQGIGTVTDVNLVTGNLYVKLLDSDALPFKIHRDNVSRASNPRKANKSQNNE
jgi:cell fate regulator YaaT (PSP1 superfamily)